MFGGQSRQEGIEMGRSKRSAGSALVVAAAVSLASAGAVQAQAPEVVDANLGVRSAGSGLIQPVAMAFIGPDDMLVLEKASGRVQRVVDGTAQGAVLDLAVNNNSERGLLGIALHPNFAEDRGVYLFWTCRSTAPLDADPFTPEEQECSDANMLGADTNDVLAVPLLGNRVDRFEWDGSALTYESNLVKLLAFQN